MNIINRIKLMSLALLVSCSLSTIFATMPQAKIEAEKVNYLKSVINPGTKHELLVKALVTIGTSSIRSEFKNRDLIVYTHKKITPDLTARFSYITYLALCTAEAFLAAKVQEKLLVHETQDRIVAGLGRLPGTLVYSAYHKLFFSNKRCLQRTLNAFKKSPEMFPTATHKILEDTEKTFTTMDAKAIASVCKALRALTEPA